METIPIKMNKISKYHICNTNFPVPGILYPKIYFIYKSRNPISIKLGETVSDLEILNSKIFQFIFASYLSNVT